LNDVISTSTSSLDLLISPTIKIRKFESVPQLTTSIDDHFLITSKKMTSERRKSTSFSSISDLLDVSTNNMLLSLSPADRLYQTRPEESGILEKDASFLPPVESMNQDLSLLTTDPLLLETKLEDTNNSNVSYSCCFSD